MNTPDKIVNAVYCTYDYSKFKRLANNRIVGDNRVERLMASMSVKQIPAPIIVNEKMQIIDGQGRYEAEKKLGLPIYYSICKGTDIDDCRRMNQYNTRWGEMDFIKSYADAGNQNYIRFRNLINELNIPITRALRFANKASQNKSIGAKNIVEEGKLEWNDDNSNMVRKVYGYALDLKEALEFTKRLTDNFWKAVKIMSDFKEYDHGRMIAKCRLRRYHFSQMSNLTDMLHQFSDIYNYRSKNELHFETYMNKKNTKGNGIGYNYQEKDISTL